MPAGDGTGPVGMGPRTGRGAGYCSGYDTPGWANPRPGRGLGLARGWGRGRSRGWRRRRWYRDPGVPGWGYGPFAEAPNREQETEFLKQQAGWLKQQLDAIGQRIKELGEEA